MKKLLLIGAGLLGLCTLGLTTSKAGPDDSRDGYYNERPHTVYRDRYDDSDCYPRRRVVVREYYAPGYYAGDYRPHYYHRRPRVGFFLPLPPIPLPPF